MGSAEIIVGRVDYFATIEAIDNIFGSVPKTPPVHVDHLLVVGLEYNPSLNVKHAVTPNENPTAPAWQYNAAQFGAVEAAAGKARNAAHAIGCLTELEDRYFEPNLE